MIKVNKRQPTYKRKFNPRLVQSNTSYSVGEVAQLFGVGETAVRYWIKSGLKVIDNKTPIMIHCQDLKAFLINKQKAGKKKCNQDEMFCFSCREPRKILENAVILICQNAQTLHLKGRCKNCESFMTRKYALNKLAEINRFFNLFVNC